MKLTANNVNEVFLDCLYRKEEYTGDTLPEGAVVAEGITLTFGFHPERLTGHKENVRSMLAELPETFRDGWSFLNMCMTKDGDQWGEQISCQELVCLGLGLGLVRNLMPREFWDALPGGMPYYQVTL